MYQQSKLGKLKKGTGQDWYGPMDSLIDSRLAVKALLVIEESGFDGHNGLSVSEPGDTGETSYQNANMSMVRATSLTNWS